MRKSTRETQIACLPHIFMRTRELQTQIAKLQAQITKLQSSFG